MRLSIAGLMGAIAVAALSLAALRSASPAVAGAAIMITCGALALAVVGVACRAGVSRACWLGFALFGSTYMAAAFLLEPSLSEFPTIALLIAVASRAGAVPTFVPAVGAPVIDPHYVWFGHCIWTVVLGLIGAFLALLLFRSLPVRSETAALEAVAFSRTTPRGWHRPARLVLVLSALVVVASIASLGTSLDVRFWSGATVLLTLAILGLTVLRTILSHGKTRLRWLGAALFGSSYVALVLLRHPDIEQWPRLVAEALESVADPLLRLAVRGYPDSSTSIAAANARVWRALASRIPMRFDWNSDLGEVCKYIQESTREPDGWRISIDYESMGPHGMLRGSVPVAWSVDLEGVPLRTSLRLYLAKAGLAYYVRGGVLRIYDPQEGAHLEMDVDLLVGHCLLTLLAVGVGALGAGVMWEPRGAASTS
jgi:hypothetical protein